MKHIYAHALLLFFSQHLVGSDKEVKRSVLVPGASVVAPRPVEGKEMAAFLRENPKFNAYLSKASAAKLIQLSTQVATANPSTLTQEGKAPLQPAAAAKKVALIQSAIELELSKRPEILDRQRTPRE